MPLVQVPPDGELLSVEDVPVQSVVTPVIGEGAGLTVTLTVVVSAKVPSETMTLNRSLPV